MKSEEFMKIKNDLVEKLTISELESMILSLKRTLRQKAREAQKEAAKKIMEEQMRLIRTSDRKNNEVKQTYSSEYNDTDDWIDYFIEKQSHHF
jgi:hypothetical protein